MTGSGAYGANVGGKLDECWTGWNLKIVIQGEALACGKSVFCFQG